MLELSNETNVATASRTGLDGGGRMVGLSSPVQ